MIAFICVSNNPAKAASLERSIQASLPPGSWQLTSVDGASHDIFSGYNAGAAQTQADVLVFLHHDVLLMCNALALEHPLRMLQEAGTGFIGVAGATRLNAAGTWWGDVPQPQVMASCRGLVGCPDQTNPQNPFRMNFLAWPGPAVFGRVLVVDGVFLMCHRRTFERLGGFDSQNLSGFHFYDVDISLRAHLAGLTNYVAPIPMFHASTGNYDQVWDATRQRFLKKYAGRLPISL
ncbi:MAG TPA: glycosyltransferase [Phycisphaerae bacterium]|nr:glycosyltransferase [Phycisphaerae bacterium]